MSFPRKGRFASALALWAALHGLAAVAEAKDDKADAKAAVEVDYIELAQLLMRDGHLDRADATLRQVDLNAEGVDKARYYQLSGLLALKQKRWPAARDAFKNAIKSGAVEPVVHLYLAQAYFETAEYDASIKQLQKAGEAATSRPAAMLMWSEAHFKQDQADKGFGVLWRAKDLHPNDRTVQRTIIFRLVDTGLYQAAIEQGRAYLNGATDAADYVALGEALRQSGQQHQAQQILEQARLRFPGDERTVLSLTHVYVDGGKNLAAAMLLEEVARFKPELALETAELYRRAGRHERSLMWNARVPDQKKKLRQRLSILVEMERFGMVTSMEDRLSRLGLLDEENVRYALAYGLFKLGNFNAAETHLRQLRSSNMFERANQLRKAMESCREQGWQCAS